MKTKSKLTDPKFLARKLLKLSSIQWYAWRVDDKLFMNRSEAEKYARRLAEVQNESIWITRVKVPSAQPYRYMFACGNPKIEEERDRPDVTIYFVLGKPFVELAQAVAEAMIQANARGYHITVCSATVKMTSLDFEQRCFPDKEEPESAAA